jgi:hypothetical protein
VDDRCESAMNNLVLEAPRYCFVAFAGITSGSASNGDDSPGESILEALNESGESDDWDSKGSRKISLARNRRAESSRQVGVHDQQRR